MNIRRSPRAAVVGFEGQLRRLLVEQMPVPQENDRSQMATLPTDELMIRFDNWKSRLVHSHRREVHRSKEFVMELSSHPKEASVRRLLGKIAAGMDIGPHLSRGVRFGYADPSSGNTKNLLDLLLNDWGIHHLHLNHGVEADGFNERSADLLFAIFRPAHAFILGLADHKAWTRDEWVARSVRNWPSFNLFWRLNGVAGLERPISENDRSQLRKSHVTSFVEVEGGIFMSGAGGMMSSGVTFGSVWRTDTTLRFLRHFDENPKLLRAQFENTKDHPPILLPRVPRFRVSISDQEKGCFLSIVEDTVGAELLLGSVG